ncbi:peptidyl-prolyl cis-trans isomerase D [Catalinimonas alkaloidigena]|uniref:peptidylprolyl isomerase n=1 Tax=Catalinimonas alkaloidigena TaxID=1075417 RepID=UPI002406B6CE|nr:peptidylprolyl isomerase [Catalinimonas alkaloidigena]MDF9799869.1 peptidyl-prolyl cis-trans isomerase D [Catalinimonas alkaloidigena]
MALISKIRERTALVVGFVALGLFLFIAADVFTSSSGLFSQEEAEVGEIAEQDISIQEYQQAIEEVKYNFSVNTGRNPTEREMISIRQQAWDKLIADIAFTEQFEELGIQVTESELVDMVQGNNITPEIRQAFTNPETGEFSRDQVVSYLQNLPQLQPQQQVAWQVFENNLKTGRRRIKYDNLITYADYITTQEAQQQYKAENTVAEVQYLYVPFYAISDTAINVTDAQLQAYLDEHPDEFKVEEGRTLSYVSFSIAPSGEDTTYFMEEIEQLKSNFASASNDSSFAAINTDGTGQAYGTYAPGQIPAQLQGVPLQQGQVYGPYPNNGAYTLFKVSEATEDTVSYAKASHILFKTEETPEAEARSKAQDVLNQLINGADFAQLARENSEDVTASRGGDLGWFPEGRMVTEFEDAIFSRNEAGLIRKLIKTDYGYHIIKVTEAPTDQAYKIATVVRELYPSDATRDQAYRKADYFASSVDNASSFTTQAQQESLDIQTAENIASSAQNIRGLGDARQIVRWAYNDASVGEISTVFELDDSYVVAVLTGSREEGTASLEAVRDEVATKVRAEMKGEQIAEKLKGLTGTLDEIASAFGTDASVYSSSDLKMSSNTLPNVGFAPKAVGKAFALDAGEVSEPIQGENGVVMIQLDAITEAPEIADYSTYKEQLQQQANQRSSFNISEAVREFADIEDERYKFY